MAVTAAAGEFVHPGPRRGVDLSQSTPSFSHRVQCPLRHHPDWTLVFFTLPSPRATVEWKLQEVTEGWSAAAAAIALRSSLQPRTNSILFQVTGFRRYNDAIATALHAEVTRPVQTTARSGTDVQDPEYHTTFSRIIGTSIFLLILLNCVLVLCSE